MSAERSARSSGVVLKELVRELRSEGFGAEAAADQEASVVVYVTDPRLDPRDDPDEDRRIELVRIEHRDGQLHCPWLAGPIPDSELQGFGTLLKTLMETRGY